MKLTNNTDYNIKNVGEEIELYGWVLKKRNLGGLVFIDLRDRSGIIQLAVKPENEFYDLASSLKSEYVIKVIGKVVERESKNPKLKTGEIEVDVLSLSVINKSIDLPFELTDDTTALEDTRLKYRYLDLRRPQLQNNLITRSKVTLIVRNYLNKLGFAEVETPILCKSTPEGARDYLVPSRITKGCFYALPQSPQLYKQLLMIGGMEKYFQIAKCFRDEDLRSDRQPEFTQVDLEMSFVEEEDVISTTERLLAKVFKEMKGIQLTLPLSRMKYDDAIRDYGTDQPDLRYDMKIQSLNELFKKTEFLVFQNILKSGGEIGCILVKNSADKYSRKDKVYWFWFFWKYSQGVIGWRVEWIKESIKYWRKWYAFYCCW